MTFAASRAGMSIFLPICAPMATNTASKLPGGLFGDNVLDLVIEDDPDPHGLDAGDLLHQFGARQAIGGNAEMQHAAGQRAGFVHFDRMAKAGQMVGRRQSARAAAHDQDALAAGSGAAWQEPSLARPPDRRESARRRGC